MIGHYLPLHINVIVNCESFTHSSLNLNVLEKKNNSNKQ